MITKLLPLLAIMLFPVHSVTAQESDEEFSQEFVDYIMGYVNNIKQLQEPRITVVTYDIDVEGGSGSGTYEEDEEVTISAPETRNDNFVIKEKLVGWENLPYKDSEVTFLADGNIETKPIYETDYTTLFAIVGPAAGIGAFVFIKKQKSKNDPDDVDEVSEEDMQEMDD